jgi:hypothetical protein
MTFNEWFYSKPHRKKYTPVSSAYLAAQEAWEAAHEACAQVAMLVATNGIETSAAIRARGQA